VAEWVETALQAPARAEVAWVDPHEGDKEQRDREVVAATSDKEDERETLEVPNCVVQ
jgi:hypothetical protein